jgi:hypothetical protein
MKKNVKNTLIATMLCLSMTNIGHAFDIDETVDDEIRKNYNPSQLINDVGIKECALDKKIEATKVQTVVDENLPALPSIINKTSAKKTPDIKSNNTTSSSAQNTTYRNYSMTIRSGATFDVVNASTIADWQVKGAKVKFTTQKATYGKGYSIPAGTTFLGEIIESHRPQITCNGGLVAIKIYAMIYNGETTPILGYITKANDKKVFLNTIKGERTFLKTMWKKGNWGRNLFGKMFDLTLDLGADGATFILAPFPLAYGTICIGTSAITSPICAFFSKGGNISIPAGCNFRIKLIEEVKL